MATYIIYYADKSGYRDGYTVQGYKALLEAIRWLNSEDVEATDISIYKEGKDFQNNPDDVVEVHKKWWK